MTVMITQSSFINMLILTALWQIIKAAQHKYSTPTTQQSSNTQHNT